MVLTSTVLLAWTGVTGRAMSLGGDDSHLYYLDPWRWLRHAPLSALENGFSGVNARTYLVPFVAVLGVLSLVPVNLQGLAFGLLLSATWTGVARLLLEILPDPVPGRHVGAQVAAAVCTLAPVVAATQWSHQLWPIYWMGLLPWLLVFALRHQRTGRWLWVWLAVVVSVTFAPALSALAWALAAALFAPLVLVVALMGSRARLRPLRLAGFVAAMVAVNTFWLVPLFVSALGGHVQFAEAASTTGKERAAAVVRTVARFHDPSDTIPMRVSTLLQEHFRRAQLHVNEWSERWGALGWLVPALIVGGTVAASRRSRLVGPCAGLCVVWVLFLWLSTVNLFPGGVELMEWLTHHVPGWPAFRNFFDKFAITYALAAGLAAGAGFVALTVSLGTWNRRLVGAAVVAAWAFYSLPLLRGDYWRMPYYGDTPTNRVSEGLPDDFERTLEDIAALPPGGLLTVPLRVPAWTFLPTGPRSAYFGQSPVHLLTGRSDLNGLRVGPQDRRSAVNPALRSAIHRGDVVAVASLVRELGVRYVLTGPVGDERVTERTRIGTTQLAERTLWGNYVSTYAPQVVARHGPFAVHEISRQWRSPLLGLAKPLPPGNAPVGRASLGEPVARAPCAAALRWHQESPVAFRGTITGAPGTCSLVLRKPFHPGWVAKVGGADLKPRPALGFATQFDLGQLADGPTTIEVGFRPQQLLVPSAAGSGAALVGLAVLNMVAVRRRPQRHGHG